jgi:hypothetical protein
MMEAMTACHQNTYDAIFRQPIPCDLDWRALRSMLVAISDVVAEQSGSLNVSRNGKTMLLRSPSCEALHDTNEMMMIRHYLE